MNWNEQTNIANALSRDLGSPDAGELRSLLSKTFEEPLTLQEANRLFNVLYSDDFPKYYEMILDTSKKLRRQTFGNQVSVMAPVEVSNHCSSDCQFCGWRVTNPDIPRTRISEELVLTQVEHLVDLGIDYIELVGGDNFPFIRDDVPRMTRDVRNMFERKNINGQICVCSMAVTQQHYHEWKEMGVDAMFVWQETYDADLYQSTILAGPKARGINDDWSVGDKGNGYTFRRDSQERAVAAGLDVGLGFMVGLNANLNYEFLMALQHVHRILDGHSSLEAVRPIILGMPTWNNITTPHTDLRPSTMLDIETVFPFLAAVYFLSLPKGPVWVFPNCRVSLETQIDTIEAAGPFTSTEVKLGPGGYLPAVIRERESQNIDCSDLRAKLQSELGMTREELAHLEEDLDEGEQFVHHFHAHEVYVRAMEERGLELVGFDELARTSSSSLSPA